jgi:hypothetical protein
VTGFSGAEFGYKSAINKVTAHRHDLEMVTQKIRGACWSTDTLCISMVASSGRR